MFKLRPATIHAPDELDTRQINRINNECTRIHVRGEAQGSVPQIIRGNEAARRPDKIKEYL